MLLRPAEDGGHRRAVSAGLAIDLALSPFPQQTGWKEIGLAASAVTLGDVQKKRRAALARRALRSGRRDARRDRPATLPALRSVAAGEHRRAWHGPVGWERCSTSAVSNEKPWRSGGSALARYLAVLRFTDTGCGFRSGSKTQDAADRLEWLVCRRLPDWAARPGQSSALMARPGARSANWRMLRGTCHRGATRSKPTSPCCSQCTPATETMRNKSSRVGAWGAAKERLRGSCGNGMPWEESRARRLASREVATRLRSWKIVPGHDRDEPFSAGSRPHFGRPARRHGNTNFCRQLLCRP